MPNFIRTIAIIGGVIAVPVFGYSVIGSYYNNQSLIDMHLSELVNGQNTQTVASLNAPNWSYGIPIATPILTSAATTSGGTMASSTTEYFAVAAIDPNGGTTTESNVLPVTTDPASSGLGAEAYLLNWTSEPGAAAYAIFFGPSASSLNNYVLATTTSQYDLASTTVSSVFSGSYTKTDTTAFSVLLNPYGSDFVNGIATSTNVATSSLVATSTAFQVQGDFVAVSNGTTTACYNATAGSIFYNTQNNHEWGCNGTTWTKIF